MGIDATIGFGLRRNLYNLDRLATSIEKTNGRIATREEVGAPVDGASRYFNALSLETKASDISGLFEGMTRGIQTLAVTEAAMTAVQKLVTGALGKLRAAENTTDMPYRERLSREFNELLEQVQDAVQDSFYGEKNLMLGSSNDLTVVFDEGEAAVLKIEAVDYADIFAPEGLNLARSIGGLQDQTEIDDLRSRLERADKRLEGDLGTFAQAKSLIEDRESFARRFVNTLSNSALTLTAADLNDEGARLLALQSRQQIALQSHSLATEADRNVLRLFGA